MVGAVVHCDEEYEEGVRHFEEGSGSGSGKMMMELSLGDGEEYQGMKGSDLGKMVVEGRWRRWLGLLIKGVGSTRLIRLWQWLHVGGGQVRRRTSAGDGLEEEPEHRDWWFGPEKQRIRMLRKIPVSGETMRPVEREVGGQASVNDRWRGVCDRRHCWRSNLVSGSSSEQLA
ncbi:hypothetical protein U1Q18_041215 [Sarracenia purpurea var. burkii]